MQNNPYQWEVKDPILIQTNNKDLIKICQNYGKPTNSVVKTYIDLGQRVAYHLRRRGELSDELNGEIKAMLSASIPLHFQFNEFLKENWKKGLENYTGSKSGIQLYNVARSKITKYFSDLRIGKQKIDLYECLKSSTKKPPEIHHLLYKSIYPTRAVSNDNLILVGRSERERDFGPGQHELLHIVASANAKDKFKKITPQFVEIYEEWLNEAI